MEILTGVVYSTEFFLVKLFYIYRQKEIGNRKGRKGGLKDGSKVKDRQDKTEDRRV